KGVPPVRLTSETTDARKRVEQRLDPKDERASHREMSDVLRMAIVDPRDTSRSLTKNLLLGIDSVWLEAECSRYEFFVDVLTQTNPDIALIAIDADPQRGLALVAQVSNDFPSCSPLVVSASQEGSLILQAMRNGAREFLSYPLQIDDFIA